MTKKYFLQVLLSQTTIMTQTRKFLSIPPTHQPFSSVLAGSIVLVTTCVPTQEGGGGLVAELTVMVEGVVSNVSGTCES